MIHVQRIGNHDLSIPSRETDCAAGYDLRAVRTVTVYPGEHLLVPTGFAWAIPDGWVGLIRDRSGTAWRSKLTTRAGVIDSDYRGEVAVLLVNEGVAGRDAGVTIERGTRIAQMVVVKHLTDRLELVDSLDSTERGEGGFGSTGEK